MAVEEGIEEVTAFQWKCPDCDYVAIDTMCSHVVVARDQHLVKHIEKFFATQLTLDT